MNEVDALNSLWYWLSNEIEQSKEAIRHFPSCFNEAKARIDFLEEVQNKITELRER
jgi:hypothetical protein